MIGLLFAASLIAGPVAPPHPSQIQTLKDWALARCIARGAPNPFADDAAKSAAALLERGEYGMEVYEAIDRLVGRALAQPYGGSVPGKYVTLKCIDLYHSMALDRVVRRPEATPVR